LLTGPKFCLVNYTEVVLCTSPWESYLPCCHGPVHSAIKQADPHIPSLHRHSGNTFLPPDFQKPKLHIIVHPDWSLASKYFSLNKNLDLRIRKYLFLISKCSFFFRLPLLPDIFPSQFSKMMCFYLPPLPANK
jgi:hypothetical protein